MKDNAHFIKSSLTLHTLNVKNRWRQSIAFLGHITFQTSTLLLDLQMFFIALGGTGLHSQDPELAWSASAFFALLGFVWSPRLGEGTGRLKATWVCRAQVWRGCRPLGSV